MLLASIGDMNPADAVPMRNDAIFRIESMTKPITVAVAMTLVDEGKIGLDDPITKYLSMFEGAKVLDESTPGSNNGQPVAAMRPPTVRDLMRHTAGLDYGWLAPHSERTKLLNATSRDYPRDFSTAELATWLSRAPLASQPGTVWAYSSAIDVLGRLVEVASGKSLGALMKDRILDPLDMRDTDFIVSQPEKTMRIAEPFPGERPPMDDPRRVRRLQSGGQGLHSTATDYARFLQMLLNGGELDGRRVLSAQSVSAMTTDQLGKGIGRGTNYLPGPAYGFGLGLAVRTLDGATAPRGELGDYWTGGGAGTYSWVDPRNKLVVVFMMQSRSLREPYRAALRDAVYEALQ